VSFRTAIVLEGSYLLAQMSGTCRPPGQFFHHQQHLSHGPGGSLSKFCIRLAVNGLRLKLFNHEQFTASKQRVAETECARQKLSRYTSLFVVVRPSPEPEQMAKVLRRSSRVPDQSNQRLSLACVRGCPWCVAHTPGSRTKAQITGFSNVK